MFERIRSQFKSLQKKGQHSTLRKDQVRIPMFTKIGEEFQWKEG